MIARLKKTFSLAFKQSQEAYYQGLSAQLAFFFVLSIVPTMILFYQLLGLFNIPVDSLKSWLESGLSGDATAMIAYVLDIKAPEASANIVFILTAVWAASRIQFALMRVTKYTHSNGDDIGNFWKDRLKSMGTIILTIVAIVGLIVLLVYGEVVVKFLASKLLISRTFDKVWSMLRWPVAGGVYFLVVSFNYYVLKAKGRRYKDIIIGSIFASVGMLLVTILYSAYTSRVVNNNLLYGSMASIAGLMFWFYFISMVLVIGILLNKAWLDTSNKDNKDFH